MKARLAYLALSIRGADGIAKIFGDALGLPRLDTDLGLGLRNPVFAAGETALVLFEPDDPFLGDGAQPGLHHAGFAVDDPDVWARDAGMRISGAGGGGGKSVV